MKDHKTTNPVALITGAARRIGAGIAIYLHEAGYNVVIHCNNSINAATLLSENLNTKRPNSALVLKANLLENEALKTLIEQALAWHGKLDC